MRVAISQRSSGGARGRQISGTIRHRSGKHLLASLRPVGAFKWVWPASKATPFAHQQFWRARALSGDDDPEPQEAADLGSFFDDEEEEDLETKSPPNDMDEESEAIDVTAAEQKSEESLRNADSDDDEDDDSDADSDDEDIGDITEKDKLAYERLIIEGADVENAEDEMQTMDETIGQIQETYLDGSAYDSAFEPPMMPIKKPEDFPYEAMPEFSMELSNLLDEARMEEEAKVVRERWGEINVTGLQSRAENITDGDVYFARSTEDYDGVKKIPLAFDNGAIAIFLEDFKGDSLNAKPSDAGLGDNLNAEPSDTGLGNGLKAQPTSDMPSENNDEQNTDDKSAWKSMLEKEGVPITDLESLTPVLFVDDLVQCMSALGDVFYGIQTATLKLSEISMVLGYPSSKMKIVGIVGSHGKTSTAWILRQVLEEFEICAGIMCDIEYAILADQLTEEGELFIPTENDPAHFRSAATPYHHTPFRGRYFISDTIPDPLQVQKLLAGMAYRGAKACVIECPTHALADGRLSCVSFDVLVYTNLQAETEDSPEVFELRKSINADLFSEMDIPEGQRAIINIDDPHAQDFIDRSSEVPVVTYSLDSANADVRIDAVTYSIWESEIVIQTPLGKMQIITPLIGQHNAYNILASVAAAIAMDIELPAIVTGIESLDYIPGRYEVVDEGQEFSVVVDRANSAPRLVSLIQNLKSCGARRVFLVFGCSGYHSSEERAEMGSVAHYNADVVILTSDSPSGEAPDRVINDIVAGFPEELLKRSELWVNTPWQDPGRVPWWFEEWLFRAQKEVNRHVVEDRSLAIRGAIGTAKKNDVVVIAGRGDQDFSWWVDKDNQPIKTWYEDRKEVRDALHKLPHLRKSLVVTDRLPWTEPEEDQETRGALM